MVSIGNFVGLGLGQKTNQGKGSLEVKQKTGSKLKPLPQYRKQLSLPAQWPIS
jgi:hypothetical protein